MPQFCDDEGRSVGPAGVPAGAPLQPRRDRGDRGVLEVGVVDRKIRTPFNGLGSLDSEIAYPQSRFTQFSCYLHFLQ